MKRKFWLGVMLFALALTSGAGAFVYNLLKDKQALEVPLEQVAGSNRVETSSDTASAPAASTTQQAAANPPVTGTVATGAVGGSGEGEAEAGQRNILFKLFRPAAKEVSISADFNNWATVPLKKVDKMWQVSVRLKPGTYHYLYVVDGKKMRDPNVKATADGKSVLKVKPVDEPAAH